MSYRAKAKRVSEAVSRSVARIGENLDSNTAGRFYSFEACYGTKLQRRLSFVEAAELPIGAREFYRTKRALQEFGSVRAAVVAEVY